MLDDVKYCFLIDQYFRHPNFRSKESVILGIIKFVHTWRISTLETVISYKELPQFQF